MGISSTQGAGRLRTTSPGAQALHLPLATETKTSVFWPSPAGQKPDPHQRDLLDQPSASQAALVLERVELRSARSSLRLLADSERLSRAC